MKIVYVPSDMDAPGCYRCLFPARQLAAHGHTVVLPEYKTKEREDGRINFLFDVKLSPPEPSDIWVLHQRMERFWAEEGVMRLRDAGIATVADVDDNYEELPYWNPAFYGTHPYRAGDGRIINRSERRARKITQPNKHNRDHLKAMFQGCDALTVSTPYLASLYGSYNHNVHVLRNMVDWDIWEDVRPQYLVRRKRLRLGYLGVFKFRQGDLEVVRDVIRPIMLRHPEMDFVANSEAVHDYLGIPEGQRVTVGEYMFYPKEGGNYEVGKRTAVMDIGIIPLKQSGMSEAKSHLKGMEYNAAGIPFVCSDTESYRYWCDETNGTIAQSQKDWNDHIETLILNKTMRQHMGRLGREKAERNSFQQNWQQWQDVYEGVLGDEVDALARGAISRGAVQKQEELAFILRKARDLSPKLVVEVGSATGGTFWSLCQVADPLALLVSIDIPGGSIFDRVPGVYDDVYGVRDDEKLRSYRQPGQRVKIIRENSQMLSTLEKLVDTIGVQPIDLLFIDADHTYEGVKRDYNLYSPLVREGGMIVFHDVTPQNDPRSGVHRLWAEIKRKHTTVEYVSKETWGRGKWGGVGIVAA